MQKVLNTKQLRSNFKSVVLDVQSGDEFILLYRSKPVLKLVPFEKGKSSFSAKDKKAEKENKYLRAFDIGRGIGSLGEHGKDKSDKQLIKEAISQKHSKK